MTLTRTYHDDATTGTFVIWGANGEEHRFYTIEPAKDAVDPEPVPTGLYKLECHDSAKYGRVWAMVNEKLGVSHYKHGSNRFACLFAHSGNFATDSEGCVLVGKSAGVMVNPKTGRAENAVLFSKDAVKRLKELLPWESHELLIR